MLTERAISIIGIILGSSLVAVAIAGEVTDCQTRVTREPGDLGHWSWRTIDGKQCWYRGDRWKPKHELRWGELSPSAAPSAGPPENDDRTDGLDAGPTAHSSTDNTPEEWRAQFADLWPEAFELTGDVERGDPRPGVRPAQPLWPIVFLSLALLAMWQLARSGTFASRGPTGRVVATGTSRPYRSLITRRSASAAAMWGGGMTLVVTYLLDFFDGAPRPNHLFLIGGILAAFSTVALAEEVTELLGIRQAKAPAQSRNLATQPLSPQ